MDNDDQQEATPRNLTTNNQEHLNTSITSSASTSIRSALNQSLLSILLCPVCWEHIIPPIHQCVRGHLICLVCKIRLGLCPTCRSSFAAARNLAMEKVAYKILYPCKNDQAGCKESLKLMDKANHESNCLHRIYSCILHNCSWNGKHDLFLHHMTHAHSDIVFHGDTITKYIKLGDESTFGRFIICAYDEVFSLSVIMSIVQEKIIASVQFVGPKNMAQNYYYTIRVETCYRGIKRAIEYTRTTHDDQLELGDGFVLSKNKALLFGLSDEGGTPLTITVKKNL